MPRLPVPAPDSLRPYDGPSARPNAVRVRECAALGLPLALGFVLLFSTRPAAASDGVLEINQSCAVNTGCFSGDTAGFPVTINGAAGRSYRLTSDLVVPNENTDGISISTSYVGIDLNNFTIKGPVVCNFTPPVCTPSSGTGSGIEVTSIGLSGVSVRDGAIHGMGEDGVRTGSMGVVTRIRVHSNRLGGIIASDTSTLSGNTAARNGGTGISAGVGSNVSGNTAYQNGEDGFFANFASTVSGNTTYENGDDGIDVREGTTVSGNTVMLNLSDGISSGSGSNILGNTVMFNSFFGLNLGAGSGYRENVISSNTAGPVNGTGLVNLGNNACNGTTICP